MLSKYCLLLFAIVLEYSLNPVALVHAQDDNPPGFVSIDCGLPEGSDYKESTTGIYYKSDADLIDSGESRNSLSTVIGGSPEKYFSKVRSFPQGKKNCYTIKPSPGKGNKYLIRASFLYGNYDNLNEFPTFDLNLGADTWSNVVITGNEIPVREEIIHVLSSDYIHVCLIKTGTTTPFISALELRPLNSTDSTYTVDSRSLRTHTRTNCDSDATNTVLVRYNDDIYDRIWIPHNLSSEGTSTSLEIHNSSPYPVPQPVLRTACKSDWISYPFEFQWDSTKASDEFYIYFHFTEVEELVGGQYREFNIYINGQLEYNIPVVPPYLRVTSIYSTTPHTGNRMYTVSLNKTSRSTLPPIINAFEIYTAQRFSNKGTDETDVSAILNIKSTYKVIRDWQGDPCEPDEFPWDGLKCSYPSSNQSARIISLDLSNSRLTGEIAPSIANLTQLKTLDLSNNDLSGQVPEFLSHLPLSVLNLKGNKFTGPVPAPLLENQKNGTLSLRYDGSAGEKKNNKSIPAVVGTVLGSILLAAILFGIWMMRGRVRDYKILKKQQQVNTSQELGEGGLFNIHDVKKLDKQPQVNTSDIKRKDKQFPHSQEVDIPGNSHKELGEDPISMANNLEMTTSLPAIDANHSSNLHNGDNPDNAPATNTSDIERRNRQYTYSEVLAITGNLRKPLGEGGFGTVFEGNVDGKQVAVKMLSPSSDQGYIEFQTEVELLMTIHHKNLTSLVGYCYEDPHMGIIYEYMANGSLDKYLSSENSYGISSWVIRLQIALDAALGLQYLHHGCTPAIIHRDVKTTNILLDEQFQAKLGDFGLSKAYPAEGATHINTNVAGTPGYIDPYYENSRRLTEKSDVFSFGVVLIEMITGTHGYTTSGNKYPITQLLDRHVRNGDFTAVDQRFVGNFDETSMRAAFELAVTCVSETPSTRPTMNTVVKDLKECLDIETDSRARPRPRRASA